MKTFYFDSVHYQTEHWKEKRKKKDPTMRNIITSEAVKETS